MVKARISFYYGNKKVLHDVRVDVARGEILAILGPNGSGKTTLIKCLAGILHPEGEIIMDGFPGYVPQMPPSTFPYSVLEMVIMGRARHIGLWDIPTEKDYIRAMNALKMVGIVHLAHRPYTEISGGELRLVLIARALTSDARILLLDEPTAHLDFKNSHRVLKVIRKLANEGYEVVVSMHDPNECIRYADKVLLLNQGKVKAYGPVNEIITQENLESLYGVNLRIENVNGTRVVIPC